MNQLGAPERAEDVDKCCGGGFGEEEEAGIGGVMGAREEAVDRRSIIGVPRKADGGTKGIWRAACCRAKSGGRSGWESWEREEIVESSEHHGMEVIREERTA